MYIIIGIFLMIIISILIFSFTGTGRKITDFFYFFAKGKDQGFSAKDLLLLWRVAVLVDLENKPTLFWSDSALNECIGFIARQVENPLNNETKTKMQIVLNKLYNYRTKIELEKSEKKRSLESTHEIFAGQICIILVPNQTTFYGKVIANTKDNIVLALFDASFARASTIQWYQKFIRIYFWRQKDAGYIFPSKVVKHIRYEDKLELFIEHSNKLVRTQKRKSIRAGCNFEAKIFPLKPTIPYDSKYEKSGGINCTINDISEDGAMLFVKGKAARGVRIKLQFKIKNIPIVMCGKIVRFMYNNTINKSRVHFQCELLDQESKNTVLAFVYNISSENNSEFISTLFDEVDNKDFAYQCPEFEDEGDDKNKQNILMGET